MPVIDNIHPMVTGIGTDADGAHGREYSANGHSETVAILPFHYPADSIEERIAEALRTGGTIEDVIREELEQQELIIMGEGINAVLGLILESDKPKLAAYQIAFAAGLHMVINLSMQSVALDFGITKQAMQQGIKKYAERLGLRKTRTMRSADARRNMALSNHRHTKLLK